MLLIVSQEKVQAIPHQKLLSLCSTIGILLHYLAFFFFYIVVLICLFTNYLLLSGAYNPLIPMSDQERISPYNINTLPSRQVVRIKTNMNQSIT